MRGAGSAIGSGQKHANAGARIVDVHSRLRARERDDEVREQRDGGHRDDALPHVPSAGKRGPYRKETLHGLTYYQM